MSTKIPYIDESWSPIAMRCSFKACKCRVQCWHLRLAKRLAANPTIHPTLRAAYAGETGPILWPERLDKPLHWKRSRRIGVQFMGDLFDEQVPYDWIERVYRIMSNRPEHAFFILTKQPENMELFHWQFKKSIELLNVWSGVSITDQEDADRMIPELLKIPGKKWVSIEPQLGKILLNPHWFGAWDCGNPEYDSISWIVLGAESGPKRRPCPHEWMIDAVRQTKEAGVPVWFKQVDMGKWVSHNPEEWPAELKARQLP